MGETNESLKSQLESIKMSILPMIQSQLSRATDEDVCAEELGELMDMVKDASEINKLDSEAAYYCAIVKAMKDRDKDKESSDKIETALLMDRFRNQESQSYYGGPRVRYPDRDFDEYGRMYYDSRDERRGRMTTERGYVSNTPFSTSRDYREGRSPISRKGYMESKEMHMDKSYQMQELEKYMKELGEDITEMISDATPEEKKTLKDKLTMLAQKIV